MNFTKSKIILSIVVLVFVIAIFAFGLTLYFTHVPIQYQYRVESVEPKANDKIKVGIISDCQLPQVEAHLYGWDYMTVTGGPSHLIKALQYFKTQDVDMIVLNGDVVNSTGDYAAYSAYNKILDYVFGEDRENMPHIIYPMGNHEFYGGNQEHTYYKATKLPLNTRTIVNGYSFISISNSKLQKGDEELAQSNGTLADGTYNPKRINFLKEQLSAAAKDDPEKPIFVFLHMPIDSSINGGHWATPQYEEIYDILKQYPQAVVFTSHSHYCMSDERSIMQKDFTMVNTGTSSYFDFDWIDLETKENNKFYGLTTNDLLKGTAEVLKNRDYLINPQMLGINKSDDVPYRDLVNNGMILNIDTKANSFTLEKINLNNGLPFGDKFEMNEFSKDSFTRTPKLLKNGEEPVFKNKNIDVQVKNNNAVVTFDSADPKTPVKYYLYELEDENGNIIPIRFFGKNYILGSELEYSEQNIVYNLKAGDYKLRVYAVNSFNLKSSQYLSTEFTIE